MKKGEVINFDVLQIQSALDKYQKTNTLPKLLLHRMYTLDDILRLHSELSPRHKDIADNLKDNFDRVVDRTVKMLRGTLTREYKDVMDNLSTTHSSFIFSSISKKYRSAINPVRALYYELREVAKNYNPENEYHHWLIEVVSDINYKTIILDALRKDISRLEYIIKTYHIPIVTFSKKVPLELFHARQTVDDFETYYTAFRKFDRSKIIL